MPLAIKKLILREYDQGRAEVSRGDKPFHKKMPFLSPFGLQSKPLKKSSVFSISFGSLRFSFVIGSMADFKRVEEGETVLFNHFKSFIKLDRQDTVHISSKDLQVSSKDMAINRIKILEALKTLTGVYMNGSLNAGGNPVICTDNKLQQLFKDLEVGDATRQ